LRCLNPKEIRSEMCGEDSRNDLRTKGLRYASRVYLVNYHADILNRFPNLAAVRWGEEEYLSDS